MAELERVRIWGEALIRLHLDPTWSFGFDNAKRRAGACNYRDKRITVSRYLAARFDDDEIHQVLLHEVAHALAGRLHQHYPQLDITLMQPDPAGHELVVNATPLGMKASDPLPLDVDRLAPGAWVGEVVMTQEYTPLLRAAQARQCHIQRGTDMLFEMIPAYLRFFDLPVATPEQLRALAEIRY